MTSSNLEEDATLGARTGAKFIEWHKPWRVGDESVPGQYKPWEDLELRKQEEALPSLSVKALRRSAMASKATTGARVDGFHSNVSLDLSDECCGRIHTLLHEIQMAGVWPIDAGTVLFCFHSKRHHKRTSNCFVADAHEVVGMAKRFHHLWVEVTVLPWLGRLLQIGWSRGPCLLGFLPRSGGIRSYRRKNQRFSDVAVTFVVDLAKAPEREQLSAVWHWAGHFVFRRECCLYSVVTLCMQGAFCSKTDPSGRCFCWGLSCMMQWPKCSA